MKSLWNMLNKEFTIEGAVSAFLVINIIAWTLITMGIYGGLIVGLIGGILYLYELYRHHSME